MWPREAHPRPRPRKPPSGASSWEGGSPRKGCPGHCVIPAGVWPVGEQGWETSQGLGIQALWGWGPRAGAVGACAVVRRPCGRGPSAWWLNPEALPPVGGSQCPGWQSPLRLPSGFRLWEAPLSSLHSQPGFSPKYAPASGGPSWRTWIFLHPCVGASAFQVQSPAPESRPSTPLRLPSAWSGQGRAGPQSGDLSGLFGVPLTTPTSLYHP